MYNRIYFVIPVYNESQKVVQKVIDDIYKEGYNKIVLVNDGSKELNLRIKKGTVILKHKKNKGQGAALRTGTNYCLKRDCKYIVHFDSDGQMSVKDLPKFIEKLETGKYDIVLGSRFLSNNKIPFRKYVVLKGGVIVTWLLSRIWLTDTHNGYRVFRKEIAKKIEITLDDFSHASEIIDNISKKKLRYCEVPINIIYNKYTMKKGQKITNAFNILLTMLRKKVIK